VHLVLSLQRPDASVIGGAVRENLGTIIQLIAPARPPSPEALRMVFPTDYVPVAMEEIAALGDGRSPGFALAYAEGGSVQGFRVGFIEPEQTAAHAERLGIPLGIPLVLAEREAAPGTAVKRPYGGGSPQPLVPEVPVVVELGEFAFTLDDLDEVATAPSEQR